MEIVEYPALCLPGMCVFVLWRDVWTDWLPTCCLTFSLLCLLWKKKNLSVLFCWYHFLRTWCSGYTRGELLHRGSHTHRTLHSRSEHAFTHFPESCSNNRTFPRAVLCRSCWSLLACTHMSPYCAVAVLFSPCEHSFLIKCDLLSLFKFYTPATQTHQTNKHNFVYNWVIPGVFGGLFSVCSSGSACVVLTNYFCRQRRICSAVSFVSSHSRSPELVAQRERCWGISTMGVKLDSQWNYNYDSR